MSTAYIGIGSNLGSREENCERAIKLLIVNGITFVLRSSMIETEPWGV
ncbi:MAG: 7,8-dihydro-6-hydroxymethylpterin-pyrophosphokinase, partial [Nitrospirae bacterium]|nr:7,8-dihydro-6-hydroxymethylpterin-pyrophosphokinase [Nitrospirota bacterium]